MQIFLRVQKMHTANDSTGAKGFEATSIGCGTTNSDAMNNCGTVITRKTMGKVLGYAMVLFAFLGLGEGANAQCPNLDFSYGNFANWQYYMGSCASQVYSVVPSAPVPDRVDIMNAAYLQQIGQFYDEVCTKIPKVPDGYNFSCKLGNSATGAQVDGIEYTLRVDSTNSLLLVSFAWVLESPPHSPNEQPRFIIQIKDSIGNVLDIPCGNKIFIPDTTLPNIVCKTPDMVAQDWITVGISLDTLIGQIINIYFETRDCAQTGHSGYAYVTAKCSPMETKLTRCEGSPVVRMKAPDGFASYTWTRSSNSSWRKYTQQINEQNPMDGEIFIGTVTDALGCQFQVKYVIEKISIISDFMFGIKDANNHVDFESNNNQSWYDTCSRTVTLVDLSKVNNSKKEQITWEILGLPVISHDSIFTYTFPEVAVPTTYLVRLTVWTENFVDWMGYESSCGDTSQTRNHYITIYPRSPKCPIYYSATICQGASYTDNNFANLTQAGDYYDTLQSSTGEDSIMCLILTIYPQVPVTNYSRSICQGEMYNDDNFSNLTQAGIYYKTLKNVNGCDSVMEFILTINPLPAKPTITPISADVLLASSADCYQWYFEGSPINGATQQFHTCTQNGVYYVEICDENGCKSNSDTITVNPVGIVETHCNASLRVYPNPTTGQLTIDCRDVINHVSTVEIYDVVGQCVMTHNTPLPPLEGGINSPFEGGRGMSEKAPSLLERAGGEVIIDISHLSAGMYFLKVGTQTVRFVKE